MSALLVLIMKSEAMKAFPHSHGLRVSRSQDHGRMVSGFPVLLLKRKALDHSWGHIEGPKKSNLCRSLKGPTYRRSAIRRARREGRATPALANVTSLRFMITLMSCRWSSWWRWSKWQWCLWWWLRPIQKVNVSVGAGKIATNHSSGDPVKGNRRHSPCKNQLWSWLLEGHKTSKPPPCLSRDWSTVSGGPLFTTTSPALVKLARLRDEPICKKGYQWLF